MTNNNDDNFPLWIPTTTRLAYCTRRVPRRTILSQDHWDLDDDFEAILQAAQSPLYETVQEPWKISLPVCQAFASGRRLTLDMDDKLTLPDLWSLLEACQDEDDDDWDEEWLQQESSFLVSATTSMWEDEEAWIAD